MAVLKLDVKVGQAVQIGDDVAVRIEHKSGHMVRLAIAAMKHVSPIQLIPSGLIPRRLVFGITGEPTAAAAPGTQLERVA